MKIKHLFALLFAAIFGFTALTALAQKDPMVGGSAMYPSKNIVQNAVNSKDHTTLVQAVKAAGLVETLESPGPFTVFAPTNEAFDKLPAGTVETLMKPENKDQLKKVLTYHVVAGKMSSKDIEQAIQAGGGKAELKTVEGGTLTATEQGGKLMLTDEKGGMATVTIPDVYQSNGVIHVINAVLLPNKFCTRRSPHFWRPLAGAPFCFALAQAMRRERRYLGYLGLTGWGAGWWPGVEGAACLARLRANRNLLRASIWPWRSRITHPSTHSPPRTGFPTQSSRSLPSLPSPETCRA